MSAETHNVTPPLEAVGTRLDRVLTDALAAPASLTRTRIKALIEAGQVTETAVQSGATIKDPSYRVKPNERFRVAVPDATPARPVGQKMDLDILYEDAEVIVINKPAGLVVHPAPGNPDRTLVNALIAQCGPSLTGIGGEARPGIVHRLDKDTSGVMVAAKTAAAHASLTGQFADRSIGRAYRAVAWGVPQVVAIEGNIGRHPTNRKKMAVVKKGGKPALTHLKVITTYLWHGQGLASFLDLRLATGRTHQIRVHLAHTGHPIIADQVYGRAKRDRKGFSRDAVAELNQAIAAACSRQALHAYKLDFDHPADGQRRQFEAPLPPDMTALVDVLRGLAAK